MKTIISACAIAAALLLPSLVCAATDPGSGTVVFPGAKLVGTPDTESGCGMTQTLTVYDAAPATFDGVLAFYRKALTGVTPILQTKKEDAAVTRSAVFLTAGGSRGVIITKATYSGITATAMASDAKSVTLGFGKFSPPRTAASVLHPPKC